MVVDVEGSRVAVVFQFVLNQACLSCKRETTCIRGILLMGPVCPQSRLVSVVKERPLVLEANSHLDINIKSTARNWGV